MKVVVHVMLLLLLLAVPALSLGQSNVESSTIRELDLRVKPLDVASSMDGLMLYVLTPGEIQVYSLAEGKVTSRVPVDKDFDRLTASPRENTIILTSSTKSSLKVLQLDFIQNIDVSGHPFKGPQEAPVTVAVFSDYQ